MPSSSQVTPAFPRRRPHPSWFALRLADFGRYRDIVWYRTLAGLKSEARQNFLGYVWFMLEPAVTTTIMYVACALVLHRSGKISMATMLIGSLTWSWFESSVSQGMLGIKGKLHIMMHFSLPKYVFPLVAIFINTWKFLCVFLVLLAFCAFCGFIPNWDFFYLPLVLGAQLVLIIGLSLPLAIGVTYFNDLTTITSSIFRLMMFMSGVFFSESDVPASALPYFLANPMAGILESYRSIILNHHAPSLPALLYAVDWGLIFAVIGLAWTKHVDGKILKRVSG
jgi:ABC-type polysaccharide/polyol phosphate export permease